MKRMTKLLAVLAVGAVATAGVVGLAACGEKGEVVTGEYHYANAWDKTAPDYGIKVNVTVKGDEIVKVEIAESDYVEVTDSWKDKALWNDGIDELLAAYEGLKVSDVEAVTVTKDGDVPSAVSDEDLMISGATQGSGRLLLAVQDALSKLDA